MTLAPMVDARMADLRWAWRAVHRAPGTSAIAVLSLALGIGANTAIFSLVNAVLLRALPVPSPQELRLVAGARQDNPRSSWNYPDYLAFRDRSHGFAGLAAMGNVSQVGVQVVEGQAAPVAELTPAQFVSGNFFDVLGVRPALGRLFNAQDDRVIGGAPYVVLGHDYWRSRFASSPAVIGRTVRVNGYPFSVIGVAGSGFNGTDPSAKPSLYVPMTMRTEAAGVPVGVWNSRHYWWFQIIGRVPAGTAAKPLEAQLTSIERAQDEEERRLEPNRRPGRSWQIVLLPAANGFSFARRLLETPLLILMAVVGFVLLIACANVANVMLARGASRQREIALRMAVGAGRRRVAMQFVTEGLLVAGLGAVAGVALAYGGIPLLLARYLPETGWGKLVFDLSPDLAMLGFTIGVSFLTGLLAGLGPALQATRPDLVPALKDDMQGGPGGRVVLRRLLVVTQVALSLLLLVGAALFVRSLSNLRDLDLGFRKDRTVIAFVDPSRNGYKGQDLRQFYERLRADVERVPGVRSASLAHITPLSGMQWNGGFSVEGYQFKAGEDDSVYMNAVGPRYFETVGIPLILGREFRDEDNPAVSPERPERLAAGPEPEAPGRRVAIVSASFVRRYLSGGSAIGRRLCLTEEYDESRAYEVIGVVRDARYFGVREETGPMVYLSVWRPAPRERALCVRAAGNERALLEAIRKAVSSIDPAVPLLRCRTIEQEIDADILQERLLASLAGFFGGLALLLAGVGLYGVISYMVARRTREIGIRLALGAERRAVLWLVMKDAVLLVGLGAAIGLPAALALSRLIRSLLYGVSPEDPATIVIGAALLLAVTALAVVVPARRALGVQPNQALRYE